MNNKNWALLFLLAFIWGGSFYFGRVTVIEVPPLTVVFFRVFLAALALWVYLIATGRKFPFSRKFIGAVAIMSILNNVIPFSLILYGQTQIGSGLASLVNAMTPIWTIIFAHFFTTDEKFSSNRIAGVFLGFCGVGVMMGADLLSGLFASALAQVMVLTATISYGCAGVFGKRFKDADPIAVSTGQLTASSLIMLPIALFVDHPWKLEMPSLAAILSIIALAVVCTAIAYVIFFRILASAGATFLSLVTFLVPVSAIILGILLLDEVLTLWQLVGMGLIAAGLIAVDGRLFTYIRQR